VNERRRNGQRHYVRGYASLENVPGKSHGRADGRAGGAIPARSFAVGEADPAGRVKAGEFRRKPVVRSAAFRGTEQPDSINVQKLRPARRKAEEGADW